MKKIILIDDHFWFRSGIAECIKHSDWHIVGEAGTVSESDKLIEKFTKNVISHNENDMIIALVDISFKDPVTGETSDSGFSIVKKLKRECPYIKSIMLSSYETSSNIQKSLSPEFGAMGFISKSSDEKILFTALDTVANNRIYVQPDLVSDLLDLKDFLACLTKKEREVAECLSLKNTNQEVAEKMNISVGTVENYITRLYDKSGTNNRFALLKKLGKV